MILILITNLILMSLCFRLLNSEIGNDLDTYYEFDTDEFVFSSP